MFHSRKRMFRRGSLLPLVAAVVNVFPAFAVQPGEVELIRDRWGVPHVFADTDAGAMFGLGYATVEDRAFQMTYSLRVIQGRLAEVMGDVPRLNGKGTSVDNDKKMRTFGFYRAAKRVAASLDGETQRLLRAYCDGVNACFAAHAGRLHYLFGKYGVTPEPWTPADCLASWWHMGQFFATDGTRDLIARRDALNPGRRQRRLTAMRRARGRRSALPDQVPKLPPDDHPAVVQPEDVSPEWVARVNDFARQHGMLTDAGAPQPTPKFSHTWVVGGARTTTGSAVLVSDPQTPVRNPSLFYEFHIVGKSFNVRGIGVPGSPVVLVGFTEHVAWGCTALGADQADLFLLKTDAAHPNQYFYAGRWRQMTVRPETIQVRGQAPVSYVVRETVLGPVATAFCFARRGEEVALKRIPVCETDRETVQAAFGMWRARNAREFGLALPKWRFPSCNMLWGDRDGSIGYQTLVAVPLRSPHAPAFGRAAGVATSPADDWQGILPYDLLPHVLNPKRGYLYSANHRAIGSWYPIPFGNLTGGGGDTERSWRLRERLQAKQVFTPADVLAIHYDSVNPARRDLVRLGLHLRDVLSRSLSADALHALDRLEPWYRDGASSDLSHPGAEIAMRLNTFFRVVSTDLALKYGGGESGLAYWLKTVDARLDKDPRADVSSLEQDYVDRALAGAWRAARAAYGRDGSGPEQWNERARRAVRRRKLGYYESLDGFPSLDPRQDLHLPALTDVDGGTINSQASQCYTQWVPLDNPDDAHSLNPIGQSERLDSPFRTCNMELWVKGELHPAPLSRAAVARIAVSREVLSRPSPGN